jgi:hypothetical protein
MMLSEIIANSLLFYPEDKSYRLKIELKNFRCLERFAKAHMCEIFAIRILVRLKLHKDFANFIAIDKKLIEKIE